MATAVTLTTILADAAQTTAYAKGVLFAAMKKAQIWRYFRRGNGGMGRIYPSQTREEYFAIRYRSHLPATTIAQKNLTQDSPSYLHWSAVTGQIVRLAQSVGMTRLEQSRIDVNMTDDITTALVDWAAMMLDVYAVWAMMPDRTAIPEGTDDDAITAALLARTAMNTRLNLQHIGTHHTDLTAGSGLEDSILFSAGDAGAIADPVQNQYNSLGQDNKASAAFFDALYQKAIEEGRNGVPTEVQFDGSSRTQEKAMYPFFCGPQLFGAIKRDTQFLTDRRYATVKPIRDSAYTGLGAEAVVLGGIAIIPVMHPVPLSYGTPIPTADIGNGWVKQVGFLGTEECVVSKVYMKPTIGMRENDAIKGENVSISIAEYVGAAKTQDYRASTSASAPTKWDRLIVGVYTTPSMRLS